MLSISSNYMNTRFEKILVIFGQVNYTKKIITVISFLTGEEIREGCSMYRGEQKWPLGFGEEKLKKKWPLERPKHTCENIKIVLKEENDAVTFNI